MLTQLKYIICLISFSWGTLAHAQSNDSLIVNNHAARCIYCKSGHSEELNPYANNFKTELPYFSIGLGLLSSGLLIKVINGKDPFTIDELNALDKNDINPFDRGATYNHSIAAKTASDIILYSGIAIPTLFFLTNHHTSKDISSLSIMGLEVISITSGLTFSTKYIFNRTRPLVYNPTFSISERTSSTSRTSFFSGHTSTAAAMSFYLASVFTTYHPNMKTGAKIGIWSFAIALPAVTGYLRVESGKHFNSDVLVGYAVGATVGWLVPYLHKKKQDPEFSMLPYNFLGASGLVLNWRL